MSRAWGGLTLKPIVSRLSSPGPAASPLLGPTTRSQHGAAARSDDPPERSAFGLRTTGASDRPGGSGKGPDASPASSNFIIAHVGARRLPDAVLDGAQVAAPVGCLFGDVAARELLKATKSDGGPAGRAGGVGFTDRLAKSVADRDNGLEELFVRSLDLADWLTSRCRGQQGAVDGRLGVASGGCAPLIPCSWANACCSPSSPPDWRHFLRPATARRSRAVALASPYPSSRPRRRRLRGSRLAADQHCSSTPGRRAALRSTTSSPAGCCRPLLPADFHRGR